MAHRAIRDGPQRGWSWLHAYHGITDAVAALTPASGTAIPRGDLDGAAGGVDRGRVHGPGRSRAATEV